MEEEINSHDWSTEEALFYLYLTTIPLDRARNVLAIREKRPRQPISEFAENMAKAIPDDFFLNGLPIPNVPRFVVRNGKFHVQHSRNPDGTQPSASDILPEEIRYLVRQRSVRVPVRPPGRKRSLNSFMVFRAFLSPALEGVSQMSRSRTLAAIWVEDPLRAVWALVAASYTTLRDHFYMPDPSLKRYITAVCGFLELPIPSEYLEKCGWLITRGSVPGSYSVTRSGACQDFSLPTLSVDDIVQFCRFELEDYAIKRPDSQWPFTIVGESTMAVSSRTIYHPEIDQSNIDPIYWFDFEQSRRCFTWNEIYGQDDESVPMDEFVFVPSVDAEQMQAGIQNTEALYSGLWPEEVQLPSFD